MIVLLRLITAAAGITCPQLVRAPISPGSTCDVCARARSRGICRRQWNKTKLLTHQRRAYTHTCGRIAGRLWSVGGLRLYMYAQIDHSRQLYMLLFWNGRLNVDCRPTEVKNINGLRLSLKKFNLYSWEKFGFQICFTEKIQIYCILCETP